MSESANPKGPKEEPKTVPGISKKFETAMTAQEFSEAKRKKLRDADIQANIDAGLPIDFKDEQDASAVTVADARAHLRNLLRTRVQGRKEAGKPAERLEMGLDYFESFFGPSAVGKGNRPRADFTFMGLPVDVVDDIKTVRIAGETEEGE